MSVLHSDRWGLGPYAAKKKQLIAEGKLDKYGRPNENTPAEYLRALPDLQQQAAAKPAAAAAAATPTKANGAAAAGDEEMDDAAVATPGDAGDATPGGDSKKEKKKKKKDKVKVGQLCKRPSVMCAEIG
jgi:H/ACA ribonucleoprotein complex subunit 4